MRSKVICSDIGDLDYLKSTFCKRRDDRRHLCIGRGVQDRFGPTRLMSFGSSLARVGGGHRRSETQCANLLRLHRSERRQYAAQRRRTTNPAADFEQFWLVGKLSAVVEASKPATCRTPSSPDACRRHGGGRSANWRSKSLICATFFAGQCSGIGECAEC